MNYTAFYYIGKFYTALVSRKFKSFGSHSIIKPFLNSYNEPYISIGDYVNIGSFCRITVSTEFNGQKTQSQNKVRLKIGNHVDIGNNTFITANNNVTIGNNIIMSAYVFIGDHDHRNDDVNKSPFDQPLTENGSVNIEDNCLLGVKCSILKNVTIGRGSVIGANAVVTKDIPPYSVAVGNPAKVIRRYDFKKKKWISCAG